MENIKIATAQFENRSNDKDYNLSVIDHLSHQAAAGGAQLICFHECSITGYSFARHLSLEELTAIAEPVPNGPGLKRLIDIAHKNRIAIVAGLFEKADGKIYKTQVAVDQTGLIARFRKLHPFINQHITPGSEYMVFKYLNWNFGILICYDNNIIENVRATKLLGADVILMPHVTMCTPSPRPGAGFVDPVLWKNKETDPTSLRLEFDGMKGREWLMKWLPSRAYDNGVYVVFSNPIGMDDDQLKNGCSMIIDPFGDILSECRELGDCFVTATLSADKLTQAGGHRYMNARRPELYRDIIGKAHKAEQKVSWKEGIS